MCVQANEEMMKTKDHAKEKYLKFISVYNL